MGTRSGAGAWAFGVVLSAVVTLGALPLVAQEPPVESSKTSTAVKKAADPSRRVPPFFGQIGLSAEQKENIYKVRGKHQAKIEDLQKAMARVQAEMLGECEALLNDSQKQRLNLRRDAAARARKTKAATAESPVASKATEKPVN